jgi:hypothetical protein
MFMTSIPGENDAGAPEILEVHQGFDDALDGCLQLSLSLVAITKACEIVNGLDMDSDLSAFVDNKYGL